MLTSITQICTMRVEIWSDIMCPFCYIGKRRFEKALLQFQGKQDVEVIWKSFQLNPAMRTNPSKSINQYLAEIKGLSLEQARQMHDRVTEMAKEEGLYYDFDKAVVANSFDAHRLLQLAKANGIGGKVEEQLLNAYFTQGMNIADHASLLQLGAASGLDEKAIKEMLASDLYSAQVEQDIHEARQIGISGVPYFIFNDRYAVSGAQETATFLRALSQSWNEWSAEIALNGKDDTTATSK